MGYPDVREATEISGFHHGTYEAFTLHGCYVPYVGSNLPTIRDILSAPHSGVNQCTDGGKLIDPLLQEGCCGQGLFLGEVKE